MALFAFELVGGLMNADLLISFGIVRSFTRAFALRFETASRYDGPFGFVIRLTNEWIDRVE